MTINLKIKEEKTVQDPVCGMWIEPEDAADMEIHEGKIIYFCAPGCKKSFLENPELYLENVKKISGDDEF